ncbi:oligosaccharide repeat unit polymerase [Vibrio cholerae]|uniref:oligosaccharide repeat unit polymerase n=1 Tax=Vibrio cholerae TaxID=666 RepID=UPI0006160EAC|nr:oligosaccharide repeat unit polymerase [Vibrio cholerae]AKB07416.1 oligosaccharide repeat unit polymerase family protein [Vibrio cholerae]BCN20028.1 putative O-antigen polymerase [Vibrio cholerae]GHZ00489.1 oligosaccharide repeat unit polymerase family protein [Vibrio cholerae]
MNRPLKRFIYIALVWFFLWLTILLVVPITSYRPNQVFLWVLNFIFIVSVAISFLFALYVLLVSNNSKARKGNVFEIRYISGYQLELNALISSFGGVIGFLFIFYDRVFIRGIDYTAGLRAARYQWLRETTGGSMFSVIGNLIVPFGYVSLFFLVVFFQDLRPRYKLLLFLSSLLGVVGHAALNGGRSNLLIAIFVCLIIFIFCRKKDFSSNSIKRNSITSKVYTYFSLVVVLSFVIYMTMQSAVVANISLVELVRLGVESLYGQPTEHFDLIVNEYTALPIYIISYLFHGSWTAEALYSINDRPGSYLFYPISVIATSLKVMESPIEIGYFSESGAFISLPGAIYYDFGFFGVGIFGSILGFILGCVVYTLSTKRVTLLSFGIFLYPIVMFFMSPILPAYGLIYFNFVVYSFLLFGLLNRILFNNRCYWL